MTAGKRNINFEVYHLLDGRWQINTRFELEQRDEALEYAKTLDSSGIVDAVCVVREVYDPAGNGLSESIIYHSPSLKTKPPIERITRGQQGHARRALSEAPEGSAAANAAAEARKRADEKKKAHEKKMEAEREAIRKTLRPEVKKKTYVREEVDILHVIPRLGFALLVSCFAATTASYLSWLFLKNAPMFGFIVSRNVTQSALIIVFLLCFLACFIPMLRKVLNTMTRRVSYVVEEFPDELGENEELELVYDDRDVGREENGDDPSATESVPSVYEVTPHPAVNDKPDVSLSSPEPNVIAGGWKEASYQNSAPSHETATGKDTPRPVVDQTPEEQLMQELWAKSKGAREAVSDRDEKEKLDRLKLSRSELEDIFHQILAEARSVAGNTVSRDPLMRFGILLFLAGVAEPMARKLELGNADVSEILAKTLASIGTTESHARGFAANIDEYLLDARSYEMYAAGRSGALHHLLEPDDGWGFADALEIWRKPKRVARNLEIRSGGDEDQERLPVTGPVKEKKSRRFVAVLFTDIVNSTQQQTELGDEWVMRLVRSHDEIVGMALKRFDGRQIKHTGDGIMASFESAEDSVSAAMDMQTGFEKFASSLPSEGFGVRIGISAGEPIHDRGDIFGTPVSLASRVLGKAGIGEIVVSTIVKELCQGKPFIFQSLGEFELKGFKDKQKLFRVVRPETVVLEEDRRATGDGNSVAKDENAPIGAGADGSNRDVAPGTDEEVRARGNNASAGRSGS